MTQEDIENILKENVSITLWNTVSDASIHKTAKEIYKLHLEDKIKLLEAIDNSAGNTTVGFFTEFYDSLTSIKKELKTLEE